MTSPVIALALEWCDRMDPRTADALYALRRRVARGDIDAQAELDAALADVAAAYDRRTRRGGDHARLHDSRAFRSEPRS